MGTHDNCECVNISGKSVTLLKVCLIIWKYCDLFVGNLYVLSLLSHPVDIIVV